jgi:CRP-like cAMP-binding protein
MSKKPTSISGHGPTIRAFDPWASSSGHMPRLLTDDERVQLAVLASIVRFKKGEVIYRENDPANAVFNIISGVVSSYKKTPDGSEHMAAFLLPDDVFGLAAEGRYTNSAKAITPVSAYRLPIAPLRRRLAKDAELEFHVICKLVQELRQTQRHAFLLSQRSAVTKIAMFVQMIEQIQNARGEQTVDVILPMDRSDIGEYTGLTLSAVSRAFRSLTTRGIIRVRNRRDVRIIDRAAFEKIAGDPVELPAVGMLSAAQ